MTKFIGRRFNVGIAKETTRGVARAAQYWLPKTALSIDDKINFVTNDNSVGVIEDSQTQDITSKYSEGTIEGRITDSGLGLLLLAALGGENSVVTVEGATRDHSFYVNQSAQHQSLTVAVVEPNSNSGSGFAYALGMIDELEINMEIGQYATYKASFRANGGASATNTTSYTAENAFRPQDGIFKMASAVSGLAAASAISIKKANIVIKKNIEDDIIIGTVTPTDRLNRQFSVEGSVELIYDDRTYIDTDMLADLVQAIRLQFINTSVTIGSSSNPTLTIDLYRAKIGEVARKIENDEIVAQTFKFKAFYDLTSAKLIAATLRNTVAAVY